jgi:hypothetical protein
MTLRFIGKDPDSPNGDSPSVWVDEDGSFVLQGWRIDDTTTAQLGHDVPAHETVIRMPARMAPFLRKATGDGTIGS